MINKLKNFKKTTFLCLALLFLLINLAYSDDLKDFNDTINDIRQDFNSLPAASSTEEEIIDAAIKELDKAVAFADQSYSLNDIEATMATLEYIDRSLSDISKLAPKETVNDMSAVNIESLGKESSEKIMAITRRMKEKNDKALTKLVDNMIEINKKGFDPFTTTRNLKDLGVETLGFAEITKAIRSGGTIDITPNKEQAYWIAVYKNNLGAGKEDIKKDVEAALQGGIDEKIHLTKKYMKNMGATAEEIQQEIEALKAIEAGELNEQVYYTTKYMKHMGATAEEIQNEVAALEAIEAGTLSEEVHYTTKYMKHLGYSSKDIEKEVVALMCFIYLVV